VEEIVKEDEEDSLDRPLDRRRQHFLKDFFENSELYTFGIITQTGYKQLEERINAHAADVRRRFHRWFILSLVAGALMGLSTGAGLIGFSIILKKQGRAAQVQKKTTQEIQQQRRNSIFSNCTDQNERHDKTSARLIAAMNKAIEQHPEQRERIRQSSQVSLGLIDALVPKQDCAAVVRKATQ
jgi:hypothetical protein